MAYNQGHAGGGVPHQYTPEEIAYWESLGYVMDPSYVAAAPAAPVYPQYPQQQQHQPYGVGVAGPSIGAGRGYASGGRGGGAGAGGYYGNGGARGPIAGAVGPNSYNLQQPYGVPAIEEAPVAEYEDLNKLFVDPKKVQEEAEAAAALAEEEERAAKAKAAATVVRKAAGKTWEDSSLLEFDENDFRLFAGDLGNEVTDELLTKTFSKYPSFLKAKVVRDKRTDKSRGYGFISFAEPDDFARAWKEMNGKYVGNRPIKLRKSQWKDRNVEIVREPKAARGPYDPEALTRKERAKPYKVKKLNNAGR